MLKTIELQNFQSHKNTLLEFDPGVNVIVGQSDSGKTAIIRALRWMVWNRPSGDAYCSTWGGDTKVTIDTDDAYIVRSKDTENKYILGDTHFTAFGTNVPDEITKALHIDEINLQQQLDSPFLLSESPGSVAEFFNRIARLDKIDTATQQVNRWIRELTECIKYDQTSLEKHEVELTKFEHLEKFEAEVEVLEAMHERWLRKEQQLNKLEWLIGELQEVEGSIDVHSDLLTAEHSVTAVSCLITQRDALLEGYDTLYSKITDILYITDQIAQNDHLLKDEPYILALNIQIEKRDTMKMKQESMRKLVKNVLAELEQLRQAETELEVLHKRFDKEFPDMCPLCGQEVHK